MTYLEYVIALRPFLNCVNLIRGSVDHVVSTCKNLLNNSSF